MSERAGAGELLEAFLEHLPAPLLSEAKELPELAGVLRRLLEEGRLAWPGVALEEGVFTRHLAERLPASGGLARALEAVRAADVYLACACVEGSPEAIRAFDEELVRAAQTVGPSRDAAEELLQRLREKLLVRKRARLAQYAGRGPLASWVRMVARRELIELHRSERPETPQEEVPSDPSRIARMDPELNAMKEDVRGPLREAIQGALALLSDKDRRMLRLHYLDGLSLERIATVHRVPKSTAQYWVIQARKRLLERIHEELTRRFQVSPSEVDSMVRLATSQLEVSLSRLLG